MKPLTSFLHSNIAISSLHNGNSVPQPSAWPIPLAVAGEQTRQAKISTLNRPSLRTHNSINIRLSRKQQRHNKRLENSIQFTHLSSTSKNAVNALQEPLVWITRDDLDALRSFRFNLLGQIGNALLESFALMGEIDTGERFILSQIDIEEERSHSSLPLISAFESALPLTINQKDSIGLRPLQAFSLVSDIESLLPHRRGIYGNELIDRPLDHCMLSIKSGTTVEAFKREFFRHSGLLGWRLLEAMLEVSFPNFADQLRHGLLLDLSSWRDHYISTVTRRVVPKSLTSFNQRHPFGANYFKALNREANRSLQQLFSDKQVGKQLLRTPAFQRAMLQNIISIAVKEHYKAEVPIQLPGINRNMQNRVIELLRQPNMSPQAHRAAGALEKGYVDMRLLPYHQFRHACMDLFKEQR